MGHLSAMRVLDLSIWRPGPHATRLLVELGADVIKVEPPGGDPMRVFPELFVELNGGKRSIELDLKDADGRACALALAADAHVVVEGFRPGVAARLGMGPDEVRAVNPSVVYCSISGYGQDGPLAPAPGHDANYQALAGALAPSPGDEPAAPRLPIADIGAGVTAAFAIAAAWANQQRTGQGDVIDVGMADVIAHWVGAVDGGVEIAGHGRMQGAPGYGIFTTADDEALTLAIVNEDHFWDRLCRAVGLDDLAALGFMQRNERSAELRERVTEAIARLARDDAVKLLETADVPVAPVLHRREMLVHPHFLARGMVTVGPTGAPTLGHPARFRDHPAAPPSTLVSPALDEHRGQGFGDGA